MTDRRIKAHFSKLKLKEEARGGTKMDADLLPFVVTLSGDGVSMVSVLDLFTAFVGALTREPLTAARLSVLTERLAAAMPAPPAPTGERVVYDIKNPSDAYTMVSDDYQAAVAACLFLGEGKYGLDALEPSDANEGCPLFLFGGGFEEWWAATFGGTFTEWMANDDNRHKMCDALDSVLIGDLSDRHAAEADMAILPEGERAAWLAARHDRMRSSMNDIGKYASAVAASVREKLSEAE